MCTIIRKAVDLRLRSSILKRCCNSPTQRTMASAAQANGSGTSISTSSNMPTPAAAIDFLLLLQKLKTTKRTGWIRCGVQQPESIADHMYRMGVMSLLASDCGVDSQRCIRLALVHDIAEAIVGDITPHCNVSEEDKFKLEADAVQQMKQMLGPHTAAACEVEALWHEYEQQSTPESHLVKDFDKLEMIIQAHEYEQAQGLQLQQFFDSTAGRFRTETGRAWAKELIQRRQQALSPGSAAPAAGHAAAKEAGTEENS